MSDDPKMREALREAFERTIKASPYEHQCDRHGPGSAWEGQYKRYETLLAWEFYQAAAIAHAAPTIPSGELSLFIERNSKDGSTTGARLMHGGWPAAVMDCGGIALMQEIVRRFNSFGDK